jgi:hypothetical protein
MIVIVGDTRAKNFKVNLDLDKEKILEEVVMKTKGKTVDFNPLKDKEVEIFLARTEVEGVISIARGILCLARIFQVNPERLREPGILRISGREISRTYSQASQEVQSECLPNTHHS